MSGTHIFDRDGDVVLILTSQLPTTITAPDIVAGTEAVNPSKDGPHSAQFNMLVSSKHMILASSVFAAMLKVGYLEGSTLKARGKAVIPLPDDDPEAFIILLNIIHGHPKDVPRRISLSQLKNLSILVDKYQMQEVVAVFSEFWIDALNPLTRECGEEDLLPWLCISWVFADGLAFKHYTLQLIRSCGSELDSKQFSELPIPETIISKIQSERQAVIAKMLQAIDYLLKDFDMTPIACKRADGEKSACDAMVVGGLLKVTQKARLWPYPKPPYTGVTTNGLEKDLQDLEIRTLCDITHPENGYKAHAGVVMNRHSTTQNLTAGHVRGKLAVQTLKESISSMITTIYGRLNGLNIEQFK